ncbi:MAG: hypothetical protein WAW91_02420, partial [Candidatus Nanoperiomorbaceae bacterium]
RRSERSTVTSGFTIIEVALVLAIAGLIFLVVFVAWPALQNSQRDNAIRQDIGRIASALQAYKVDHQGDLPPYTGNANPNASAIAPAISPYYGQLSKSYAGPYLYIYNSSTTSEWTGRPSVDIYQGKHCGQSLGIINGGYDTVGVGFNLIDTGNPTDLAIITPLSSTGYCQND